MGSAIYLRADFDGAKLRLLARQTRNADQAWRLLALASIYDGGSRGENAEKILRGFDGILKLDGYQGYNRLTRPSRNGAKRGP